MENLRIAFASDDGQNIINRHFGDAEQYLIYELKPDHDEYLKTIHNKMREEENKHADPKKANAIGKVMKAEQVQVLVSQKFGANVKKMKKQFVCVISRFESIQDAIAWLQDHYSLLEDEWNKDEERNYLRTLK